jgi:hypothetical protein
VQFLAGVQEALCSSNILDTVLCDALGCCLKYVRVIVGPVVELSDVIIYVRLTYDFGLDGWRPVSLQPFGLFESYVHVQ